jgi:hypothetical protein
MVAATVPTAAQTAAAQAAVANFDTKAMTAMLDKVSAIVNDISGSLLSRLNSSYGCQPGTECYNTKRQTLLQHKLRDAQTAFANAPLDLSRAEKNYYEFNAGQNGGEAIYNKMIVDRFAKTVTDFKQNTIERQQDFMADLSQILKQYQGEILFAKREEDLLVSRAVEYADLVKQINRFEAIVQTSQRKVVYEYKNMDSLYTYRRVMLFLYYSIIVGYIIFGNFIPDKLYEKYSIWLMIIIAAIIPIILNIIMKWLFILGDAVAYWFADIPHKDVYYKL